MVEDSIKSVEIQSRHMRATRIALIVTPCVCAILLAAIAVQAQPVAVRSEFVTELSVPGSVDHFIRPGRVAYDAMADELYVADQGNNRIVIFGPEGAYRFEFKLAGRVGSIVDFAVTPSGFIYVLGSTQQGRKLLVYDFDGIYVRELGDGSTLQAERELTSIAADTENRAYVLDSKNFEVLILSASGELVATIPIFNDFSDADKRDLLVGTLTATDEGFLIPASSFGIVNHYARTGEKIASYGHLGTLTGELAFPVSAAFTSGGLLAVLDKQRFTILCYAPDGRFVGEFGGKGRRPGWFYFPSYLATDAADQVVISQVFMNRVQICRVPGAINEVYHPAPADAGGSDHSQLQDKTEHYDLVGHSQHFISKGGL